MTEPKTYHSNNKPCEECGGTRRYVKGLACFDCTQARREEHRKKTTSIETARELHRQRAHVKLLITPYEDVKLDYWDRAI